MEQAYDRYDSIKRFLLFSLFFSIAEVLVLLISGYPPTPELLLAAGISFILYNVFFLITHIFTLILSNVVTLQFHFRFIVSISISLVIITLYATGSSSTVSASGDWAEYAVRGLVSVLSGLLCFTLLTIHERIRNRKKRLLVIFMIFLLIFLWRFRVSDSVPRFEQQSALDTTSTEHGRRPNLIMIVIDTLRADRLGCYGNDDGLTRNIDRFREDGILFEQSIVPCPRTAQSMSTIMTGLYPQIHGVRRIFNRLNSGLTTLAETLRSQGFDTYAVVSNPVLRKDTSGLSQGFNHYDDAFLPDPYNEILLLKLFHIYIHRIRLRSFDATSTTDRVIDLLSGHDGETPFFLWIQYFDPHWIYLPPEGYRDIDPQMMEKVMEFYDRFENDRISRESLTFDGQSPDSVIDAFRRLYDGEVRYCDSEIGRLMTFLRDHGLYNESLIIVTADHGEELGGHDYYFEHGLFLYDAEVRVPLIMKPPSSLKFPERSYPSQISTVDLLQNILYIIDVDSSDRPDSTLWFLKSGDTLLSRETGGYSFGESDVTFFKGPTSSGRRRRRLRMIRSGDFKLIASPIGQHEWRFSLFDLKEDPGELIDRFDSNPQEAQILLESLKEWFTHVKTEERESNNRIDRSLLEDLKTLGYFH